MRLFIAGIFLACISTGASADEKYLCIERWGHLVDPEKPPSGWKDTALIPKAQYFIESEATGAWLSEVGKKRVSNSYNCKKSLSGDLNCMNGLFLFNRGELHFTMWHYNGDVFTFAAGDCQAI
jgi:hypothetical protein